MNGDLTYRELSIVREALHRLREKIASLPQRADGNINALDLYNALDEACVEVWADADAAERGGSS